ncbi:tol-pal system-associated acyl-CoA thioesterase [Marinicella sp. W31]|uniref:tol-pal system-associated acyl-CoA thioesterase n=1 Tax=Marinicella sp. W31 TaxID=3023713 RepID=UPI003756FB8B
MTEINNSAEFTHHVRVYYEDTDAGGVVYHSQYLNFLERTRTEWLRSKGIEQRKLVENEQILFVIRSMDIQYIKPARLDDWLTVTVEPMQYKKASMTLAQTISCGERQLVKAVVKIASLHSQAFKPIRFPDHLKQEIMS